MSTVPRSQPSPPSDPDSDPDPGTVSRLGLPLTGPGALAGLGRRALALVIDWGACVAISAAFFSFDAMATLAIFAAENLLLIGTLGFTVGHRVASLTVATLAGGPPGPLRALIRTLLLCLVVPALVWDADGRGLHDKAAGTVIVRR